MSEQEIWKQYPEYDFIEVSNLGRVRIKDHWVTYKNERKQLYKGHILKQYQERNGYMRVRFKANGKLVNLLTHRMVAITHIPNPNGYPQVNHIDNDRTNNIASNLEWCSSQYNSDYKKNFGTSQAEVLGRPVIAINPESSEVFWFESHHEAARQLGVDQSSICKVAKGKRYYKTVGGYWFCYADENAVEKTRAKFGDDVAHKVEELMKQNQN